MRCDAWTDDPTEEHAAIWCRNEATTTFTYFDGTEIAVCDACFQTHTARQHASVYAFLVSFLAIADPEKIGGHNYETSRHTDSLS